MAINRNIKKAYGLTGFLEVFPGPVVSNRAPVSGTDSGLAGQVWIDQSASDSYIMVNEAAKTWISAGGGAGVFDSLTVTNAATIGNGFTVSAGTTTITSDTALDAAIILNSTAGGIDMDAALQISIDSAEAAGDAIVIDASNAAGGININAGTGGIDLNSGGVVSMTPATDSQASPTATATINVNVGVATFTGFTTAAAASQVFTITNAVCTAASAILVSVSNLGGNDAQMTVTRVTPGAGSFTVTTVNNGAAALNGDVIITFWIIAA